MKKRTAFYLVAAFVGFGTPLSAAEAPTITMPSVANCESAANLYKARHPHTDMFESMKAGFFPFGEASPPKPPQTYRDPESGIVFYVESDGRHLAAIDGNGKLLWVRNPFVDNNMCPYRSAHPYISKIGPAATPQFSDEAIVKELNGQRSRTAPAYRRKELRPGSRFINIDFNSSQFGYVNVETGDFYDQGQN
jgi:hypothetical protein